MGLLGQFNNVLQYKQGSKQTMKMNRHVVGMYEWVMQDVANAVSLPEEKGSNEPFEEVLEAQARCGRALAWCPLLVLGPLIRHVRVLEGFQISPCAFA
eukprot:1143908-Pelagomonas_calceolata.AAC.7